MNLAFVLAAGAVVVIDDFGRHVDRAVLVTLENFARQHQRTEPPPADESGVGVLNLSTADYHYICCGEFGQLLSLIGAPSLLGGIPMAVMALILFRDRGPARTAPGRLVARAFFVFQSVSVCLWTIGFVGMSLSPSDVRLEVGPSGSLVLIFIYAVVLAHMYIGALGARAWWRLAESKPVMLTILSSKAVGI